MKSFKLVLALFALPALIAPFTTSSASAGVKIKAELGHSVLIKNKKQKAYIRIHLEGEKPETTEDRPPVNIALVIDKSGSMNGEKMDRAKDAAIMAINRLAADDILSVITYDNRVKVVAPAGKVGDAKHLKERIDNLRAGGSTALYAGTNQGIGEVRNYLSENRVNRVILISDGLANIGPSSPQELGELGKDAAKDGIAVTTIGLGLGYNEDLMAKLAFTSDGNHAFVENAEDLVKVFNSEFGDVLSVIAQDIEIEIEFHEKITPIRSLGREAIIKKNKATLRLNQIYGAQQKELILEVEAPEGLSEEKLQFADIKVRYLNMKSKSRETVNDRVEAEFAETEKDWEAAANKSVMTSVTTQIAVIENERAVKLRDKGKLKEAKDILNKNAAYLRSAGKKYDSKELQSLSSTNEEEAKNLEGRNWATTRKLMRARQHKGKTQQKY